MVAARLPASTLRHLLAALAAATGRAADEAEGAQLRARERERERFVTMVAHELRTPLAGLGGYLDLLAGGALDDPGIGREFVERGRGIVERDDGPRRRPPRDEPNRSGQPAPPDRGDLAGRGRRAGPGPSRAARRRARHPARDRPAAPHPDGAGRPASPRADRHEPRRQRLQVLGGGRPRRAARPGRRAGGDRRRAGRRGGDRTGRPASGSSGRSPGSTATTAFPARGSGCPSAGTWHGRWAATWSWRRSPGAGRRSSWACPPSPTSRAPSSRPRSGPRPRRKRSALEERAILRALRAGGRAGGLAASPVRRAAARRRPARSGPGAGVRRRLTTREPGPIGASRCPQAARPVRQIVDNPVDNPVDGRRRRPKDHGPHRQRTR